MDFDLALTIPCYPASRHHLHFVVGETLRDGKQFQLALSTTDVLVAIGRNLWTEGSLSNQSACTQATEQ